MSKAASKSEVATRRKIGHIALIISVLVIAFSFRAHLCKFSPHNISNANSGYDSIKIQIRTEEVNHNERSKKISINMLP